VSDGALYVIPTESGLPHPLGRSIVNHDARNRLFSIRSLIGVERQRKPGPWYARHNFDQGGSSCTMQATIGSLLTSPHRSNRAVLARVRAEFGTEQQRHGGYLRSQSHDPWPGGEPVYEGTSTDAPYKLLRAEGLISGWRWCFGFRDVVDTVNGYAAPTLGTVWLASMFNVDRRGYVVVEPSSGSVGGHEWLLLDFDEADDEGIMLNSWGRGWGRAGRARIRGDALRYLLEADGDAAVAVL
jgi:hypothetical protein